MTGGPVLTNKPTLDGRASPALDPLGLPVTMDEVAQSQQPPCSSEADLVLHHGLVWGTEKDEGAESQAFRPRH